MKEKIEDLEYLTKRDITRLKKLGIETIEDCFYYFPNRYEDFSEISPIKSVEIEKPITIQGKIENIKSFFFKGKKHYTLVKIIDKEGEEIEAIFYNQPFLKKIFQKGEIFSFSGKAIKKGNKLYLQHPVFEKIPTLPYFKLLHTGKIVPIYSETSGIKTKWIREKMSLILKNEIEKAKEFLPQKLLKELNLLPLKEAILKIHFPQSKEDIKLAQFRFSFEELFLLEIEVLREKLKIKRKLAYPLKIHVNIINEFLKSLNFKLTESQKRETWRMLQEMEKENPMNRLLQGDVGSGKTLVATILALNCAKNECQCAIVVPTEILAAQHYKRILKMLEKFEKRIGILTGGYCEFDGCKIEKKEIIKNIKRGEVKILIGTHSLFEEKIEFQKLALLIFDEQHKFGVEQRRKILEKQKILPHFLSMTATPIPRTLALTIFGNLDISLLKEFPFGERKVEIKVILPSETRFVFDLLKEKVKEGEQIFFVCPRIEFSQKGKLFSEVKSVKEQYLLLKRIFPDLKIAMLHGKMNTKEKEIVLKQFEEKIFHILVATNVIEEGIDLPHVNCLVIQNAEMFGLSQLYQLIGRIGRSGKRALCFLITHLPTKKSAQRIEALLSSKNALELAESDLKIRGPGEILGEKQTGKLNLKIANLTDLNLIQLAREKAKEILKEDEMLNKYLELREKLKRKKKIYFV